MNKLFTIILLLSLQLSAVTIPMQHAQKRAFGKSLKLNSQIIQLSNASGSIMSVVGGHLEKYYVKTGESIKKGQKMVLIESLKLSKMTAEFLSLKKQFLSQEKNFKATQALYKKGMASMSALNEQSMKKDALLAKLTALKSQLYTLNIDTRSLKTSSADFILYAHSDGVVSAILQPLHSSIQADTPIISLVQNRAYYLKSYLPLEYASKVKIGQKIVMRDGDENIISYITQILPKVDEITQRIVLLSSINKKVSNLFINAYTEATLYFEADERYVAVPKSALSFFSNEWVVFVEKEHNDEHGEDNHKEEHDHEELQVPYEARVVEIVAEDEGYVGLKGLEVGEEYASDKSYYVKSMMLKSSLGEHGH